jgi:TPR repeat protein
MFADKPVVVCWALGPGHWGKPMPIIRAVAKKSPGTRPERSQAWQRRTTRTAILDAARRLLARGGVEGFSLNGVAREADFASSTVYAYFVNKRDVILAIVAEDLAAFGRAIGDDFPFSEFEDIAASESEAEEVTEPTFPTSQSPQDTQPTAGTELAVAECDPLTDNEEASSPANLGHCEETQDSVADGPNEFPPDESNPSKEAISALSEIDAVSPALEEEVPAERGAEPDLNQPECGAEAEIGAVSPAIEEEAPAERDAEPDLNQSECGAEIEIGAVSPAIEEEVPAERDVEPDLDQSRCDAESEIGAFLSAIEEEAPAERDVEPDSDQSKSDTKSGEPASHWDESVDVTGTVSGLEARIRQLETHRVDAWLERRLREFERMLTVLDERMTASEKTVASANAPNENILQELRQRFEAWEKEISVSVAEKLGSVESRQHQAIGELRTRVLDISGRLEVTERDMERRAAVAGIPVTTWASDRSPGETVPVDKTPSVATGIASAVDATDDSYLAAARRAALAAQSLAQSEAGEGWVREVGRRRTRLLIGLCVGLGVVLAGVGIALKHDFALAALSQPAAIPEHAAATGTKYMRMAETRQYASVTGPSALVAADNTRAMVATGLSYLDGTGVARDENNGAHWIATAAMRGDPVAQFWLGTLFEHGRGETADPAAAIRWYEASALQGNLRAMYKLAVSYAEGWGTQKNYGEAARWFSRAAELGFVNAQYNLGVLYERGFGVPQSLLDAYKWYALAAAQGDKISATRIEALSSQMSAEDVATARQAVAAFKPEALDPGANATPFLPGSTAEAPATELTPLPSKG